MLWLRLKLSLLPCISEEVNRVSELYQMLLEEAQTGDKNLVKELNLLQASIRGRIQELEEFYEHNFEDHRVGFFEKQRLRLRKLLQTEKPKAESIQEEVEEEVQTPVEKPISTDDFIQGLLNKPSEKPQQSTLNKSKSEWKEFVFKIKLTRQEYEKLMRFKAKKMKL